MDKIFYLKYIESMITAEIKDSELLEHLGSIEKDSMSVFVMAEGAFRGALFNGTKMINQMRANLNLGILETMILGQAALCAALMIPTMKGREHLIFRYDTNGPAAGFSVEADSTGTVRGYIFQNPIPIDKPLESWDLSPFFGSGTLTVTRFNENGNEPQVGTVEIKYQNIAKDLTWYFAQSEQIHTAFNTSIQFDKQGRVIGAGGLFIQAMPKTGGKKLDGAKMEEYDDDLIDAVENAFNAAPSLGQWYSEKGNNDDIIYGLFREFDPVVALNRNIVFNCPCSEKKFTDYVRRLDKKEKAEILAEPEPTIEVICHNCGSVYHIDKKNIK